MPFQQQCDELRKLYNTYNGTQDVMDLRYLFALCLRIRHGRRMPWADTRKAVDKLINSNIINKQFTDFEALFAEVVGLLKGIQFAQGPLSVYDTALNIGILFGIYPQKYIYLNAGARIGADALMGRTNVKPIMDVSVWQTPNYFPGVDSMYIEDILCVFKDVFVKMSKGHTITTNDVDLYFKPCSLKTFHRDYALKRMGYI